MRGSVQHGLELVLRIIFKFAPEIVNKCFRVSKILPEEALEFKPCYWKKSVWVLLVLLPLMYYHFMQKQYGKYDTVKLDSSNNLKVLLILLTKTIVVHVQVSIVEVRNISFERLFLRLWSYWSKNLSLQVGFYKLFKQLICGNQSKV